MRRAGIAALAVCISSWSSRAAAQPIAHDVSVGVLGESTSWFAGTSWHHVVEVASRLSLAGDARPLPLAAVTGVRVAPLSSLEVPLEVFARLELTGRTGARMEPSIGPELGLSGITDPDTPAPGMPAGVSGLQAERAGPVYLAIVATPLRVRIGQVRLVAADFRLGSTLAGSAAVFSIGYLRAEWRL